MSNGDERTARIMDAITRSQTGDRDEARVLLAALWEETAADGDAFHRCSLAHYMADLQDDPFDKLAWDLRALDAAGKVTDERAREFHASLEVRALFPSLHLNVADAYRRTGDLVRAREHLARATQSIDALDDEGLG